jgi:hypothetical protein
VIHSSGDASQRLLSHVYLNLFSGSPVHVYGIKNRQAMASWGQGKIMLKAKVHNGL